MRKILIGLIVVVLLSGFNFAHADLNIRGPAVYGPASELAVPINSSGSSGSTAPQADLPTDNSASPAQAAATESAPLPESNKQIIVSLKDQTLTYFEGTTEVGEFLISSGLPRTPTPPGEYTVLIKKPLVNFFGTNADGSTYSFPHTKWNLLFKKGDPLNYYIHGAYWHHNFGHPMSHGCINVSYANMEPLYNWADVGTRITIE
jgi:lipoprotein-anchoring transpeptidase ErfK/SrfK